MKAIRSLYRNFDAKEIYMFGSGASATINSKSDFDILFSFMDITIATLPISKL
jgi:predicted nucleotidyltransferase